MARRKESRRKSKRLKRINFYAAVRPVTDSRYEIAENDPRGIIGGNVERSGFFEHCEQMFAENNLIYADFSALCEYLFRATEIILEKNKVMNLTAICSEEEFIARHWTDALLAEKYIPRGAKILDVGTGGGILAIAYAAARPDVSAIALDATAKKAAFVGETAKALGLKNLSAISARAEELSNDKTFRERFDFVCARAVAALPVLSELCIPFVKPNGIFCALKGKNGAEELAESVNAIKTLGGEVSTDEKLILKESLQNSDEVSERHIIIVKKIASTPEIYPRRFAQITKNPL